MIKKNTDAHIIFKKSNNIPVVVRTLGMIKKKTDTKTSYEKEHH